MRSLPRSAARPGKHPADLAAGGNQFLRLGPEWCDYSYANHWKNAAHLINDAGRASEIETALVTKCPEAAFQGAELALLRYAEKLTVTPGQMEENDVAVLRKEGLDDGQILEANQIICYFNYVNRSLNGLGVSTVGDIVGFYAD